MRTKEQEEKFKINEARASEILVYFDKVKNLKMMRERFGMSPDEGRAFLKRHGRVHKRDYAKSRKPRARAQWKELEGRDDEFDAIYKETLSAIETARRMDCTRYTAEVVLKRLGHDLSRGAWQTARAKKHEDVVIAEYDKHGNKSKISRQTGLCRPTIRKIVEGKGREPVKIERADPGYWWEPENKKRAIATYRGIKDVEAASTKLGCGKTTLLRILHAEHVHVEPRGSQTEYECDEAFFDVIDNQIKAYWYGFILADGHAGDTRLVVGLKSEDGGHLEKLKSDVGYTGPIYTSPKDGCKSVTISRIAMVKDLRALGLTSRKTWELKWQDIPEQIREDTKLFRHVIRGYLDGDGHIFSSHKKHLTTWAAGFTCYDKEFLEGLDLYLARQLKIVPHAVQKGTTAYLLQYNDRTALALADFLYKDADRYLDRKYEKYLEMRRFYENREGELREKFAAEPHKFEALQKRGTMKPMEDQIVARWYEVKNLAILSDEFGFQPTNIKVMLNGRGINTSRDYSKTRVVTTAGTGKWQARKPELKELWEELHNIDMISEQTGAARATVRRLLHEDGIDTSFVGSARRTRTSRFDPKVVRALIDQGLSDVQIGKRIGASNVHVGRMRKKLKG